MAVSNSVTDELGTIFLATGLVAGDPAPDGTEELRVRWIDFNAALAMIDAGEITDLLTIAGLERVARIAPAMRHAPRPARLRRRRRRVRQPAGRLPRRRARSRPRRERQAVAAELGFSETVFVDDARTGRIRIFTPGRELAFAGHPTVGTAWLLAEVGMPVERAAGRRPGSSRPGPRATGAGSAPGRNGSTRSPWPSCRAPAAVEALDGPPAGEPSWYAWAWQAGRPGAIRSRYFAGAVGIAEDEATGAAAVLITAQLGQGLEILQGRGSRLSTRLTADGSVELGGRVGPRRDAAVWLSRPGGTTPWRSSAWAGSAAARPTG